MHKGDGKGERKGRLQSQKSIMQHSTFDSAAPSSTGRRDDKGKGKFGDDGKGFHHAGKGGLGLCVAQCVVPALHSGIEAEVKATKATATSPRVTEWRRRRKMSVVRPGSIHRERKNQGSRSVLITYAYRVAKS